MLTFTHSEMLHTMTQCYITSFAIFSVIKGKGLCSNIYVSITDFDGIWKCNLLEKNLIKCDLADARCHCSYWSHVCNAEMNCDFEQRCLLYLWRLLNNMHEMIHSTRYRSILEICGNLLYLDDRDALTVVMGSKIQRRNDCLEPGKNPRTADIVRALVLPQLVTMFYPLVFREPFEFYVVLMRKNFVVV